MYILNLRVCSNFEVELTPAPFTLSFTADCRNNKVEKLTRNLQTLEAQSSKPLPFLPHAVGHAAHKVARRETIPFLVVVIYGRPIKVTVGADQDRCSARRGEASAPSQS